jgi:FMN-dependent oxidoreductase (nitrilotriacetate monooxygenase family)
MLNLSVVLRPGGYTQAAWRLPDSPMEHGTDFDFYYELTRAAENVAFDAVFCADSLAFNDRDESEHLSQPMEPVSLLSALASRTSHIGLIGTSSTTYYDPYTLARQYGGLDHLSKGRAGWNVVTTADPNAAANYGAQRHMDHDLRYERAAEFVEVTKKLWSSWHDGSIVLDRARGIQTDPGFLRPIDHHGRFFDVKGPLNMPRPPQHWPVLFHAGQSKDGLAVGARYAEGWFAVHWDVEVARVFYADLKRRAGGYGRKPEHIRIMPGLTPILGSTEAEAHALAGRLLELGGRDERERELSAAVGYNIAAANPDDLLDISRLAAPETRLGPQSWYALMYRVLRAKPMTVAQALAAFETVGKSGHLQIVGTPEHVADVMAEWYERKAADGFTIMFANTPAGAFDFFDHVVPILVKRGLFRRQYEGTTLREHLGLPMPPPTESAA